MHDWFTAAVNVSSDFKIKKKQRLNQAFLRELLTFAPYIQSEMLHFRSLKIWRYICDMQAP
jgi:hypothetical protein